MPRDARNLLTASRRELTARRERHRRPRRSDSYVSGMRSATGRWKDVLALTPFLACVMGGGLGLGQAQMSRAP